MQTKEVTAIAAYVALTMSEDGWVSAVTATALAADRMEKVGLRWSWSYRPMAFALRRLVRAGLAQERTVSYRTRHKANEMRREYRLNETEDEPNPLYPRVHPIPAAAASVRRKIRVMGSGSWSR